MLLEKLIKDTTYDEIIGETNLDIKGVYFDSKMVDKDSMFICINGFQTKGHLYIEEAISRGAIAIVSENRIEIQGITNIIVKNARSTMAIVARNFYENPSNRLSLVGITGTNGKTSITYMVKHIIEYLGKNVGLIGTISNWIGKKEVESIRTTPESVELQKIFFNMLKEEIEICVMEVSSHALDLGRVDGCSFSMGVFTNLTPEHLDFHENMDEYRRAKKKLFYKTRLCNIINVDDSHGKIIANEIKEIDVPLITFAINEKADVYATDIYMDIKGVSFKIHIGEDSEEIKVGIPGLFTIYNLMPAIIVCYKLGHDLREIASALNHMVAVPGRFEVVDEIHDFSVIIDYAHTPDALENILKSVKEFTKGRIITVFGCGGDRDRTKRPIMGSISGQYSDYTILTSDNPRTEDPSSILSMVEDGIKSITDQYIIIKDRKSAIEYAVKFASDGDVIIIAGKGHEKTQIIGKNILPFDDRLVVLEIARKEGRI